MNTPHTPTITRALFCLALFLTAADHARAQFATSLTLDKKNYLVQEPVQATVTVTNRSGADVVVAGKNGGHWLSFDITDSTGRSLTPVQLVAEDPFIFKSGATMARKSVITEKYALSEQGNYTVTCNIYHAPSQQFYSSSRQHFSVMDARPFFDQAVGVPAGYESVGRVHRYQLIIFRDIDRTTLYFRLVDEASKANLGTFVLGPITTGLDPQVNIDSGNKLHILFLAAPKIFAHAIIKPDGKLDKRSYFRETDGNRPVMTAAAAGEIVVQGGLVYDPSAPTAAATPKGKGRSVSERPPGL